jgi:hypothetical protein
MCFQAAPAPTRAVGRGEQLSFLWFLIYFKYFVYSILLIKNHKNDNCSPLPTALVGAGAA